MGQKQSTTPTHHTPNYYYGNAVPNNQTQIPSHHNRSEILESRVKRESIRKENAPNDFVIVPQPSAPSLGSLLSGSSASGTQPRFTSSVAPAAPSRPAVSPAAPNRPAASSAVPSRPAASSAVPSRLTVPPANKPILSAEGQRRPEPSISTGRPVAVNTASQRNEGTMTNVVAAGRNDLSKSISSALQSTRSSTADATAGLLRHSQDATLKEKKELNISSIYPDLPTVEPTCSNRNSVEEGAPVDTSAYSKAQNMFMNKNTTKLVSSEGVSNRRQRIRNKRRSQPRFSSSNKRESNVHDDVSVQSKVPECTAVNMHPNGRFIERIFLENANVVLRMLDDVDLEITSYATKNMLRNLHDKLAQLRGKTDDDTRGERDAVEQGRPVFEPEDIFQSHKSVDFRQPGNEAHVEADEDDDDDDLSEEENDRGSKSAVQHVFGDVYFCLACMQDLHGRAAAASHQCEGATSQPVDEDANSQSGRSDVTQPDMQPDVKHMWGEVNRAQKGRWYNFKFLKGGAFQCTTCDVNLNSTRDVISHVWCREHQLLLAQKRADETAEQRIWREVPRALKFNKKHFIVVEHGDGNVFVCNACICQVPFVFKDLMSHLMSKDHASEVSDSRKK